MQQRANGCLNPTAGCWILVLPCVKHLLGRTETPQIRALTHRRVNIRLSYDSPVCPAPSSRWQGISGDSRFSHKTQPCSAGCLDAMDPERGIVGFGAVVALCRTVACCVSARKCCAGRRPLPCSVGNAVPGRAVEPEPGILRRAAPVLTMAGSEKTVAFPCPCVRGHVAEFRVCVAAWRNQCCAGRIQLRGRLVPLSGSQVRSGKVQWSSAESWAFRENQGLTGALRGLLPSLTAQLR